ncbi:MAG: nucleotide exchange factor GrpE [Pyrinomonadaceae bacterium]
MVTEDEFEKKETEEVKIPVNDKRRFNEKGEQIRKDPSADTAEAAAKPAKSPREAELEALLQAEISRREAAEAKLVGVQAKFEEAKAALERETAELRARLTKSLEEKARQSQIEFLSALLPVLDNLSRAIAASESDPSLEHLREGVIGTARSFEQALLQVGVEPVPGIGADFDPQLHEAIDTVEVEPENEGKITAEHQRGYRLGGRLIRPAKVQVGKARANSAGN